MNTLLNVLTIAGYVAIYPASFAIGYYAPRLFPKHKRGTRVGVNYGFGRTIPCEYLYRSSVCHHKLRVVGPDSWDGRIITAGTGDLVSPR